MKRSALALGMLGLICAAAIPASAQKTVKLFGNTYNLTIFSREQTYKTAEGKSVTIVNPPGEDEGGTWTQKSALSFLQGADPSQDRLLVGAHLDTNEATGIWHNWYLLKGAGDDGLFSPANATVTEFFGGKGDRLTGGRPLQVMLLNVDDTGGVKKDRNVLANQWTNANATRLYDLDSMKSNFQDDELLFKYNSSMEAEDRYADFTFDENKVLGDWQAYAPLPNYDGHTILAIGQSGDGIDASIWDTRTDNFFPVHSLLTALPTDRIPHGMVNVGGNEYWILASDVGPTGATTVIASQQLFRVKMTFPADPSKGKADDIKAELLGAEETVGTALQTGDGMNCGMAIGREVKPGLRRLYFGTLDGKIIVADPQ